MSDLISRQAAIDDFDGTKVDEEYCTEYDIGFNDGIDFAVSKLSVLSSAEPEQLWIPVTERLPKENGDYLVSGRHGAVNKRKYEDGRWYGNWAVIAWMPLPEPWKGDENE